MDEQQHRGVRASEIRTPRTREELKSAQAFVRGRVESIERALETRDASRFQSAQAHEDWRRRAQKAYASWLSKQRELDYWEQRLIADADPERTRLVRLVAELAAPAAPA